MGLLDALVNTGVKNVVGKVSPQQAYNNARDAGASTGRARQAAQRSMLGQATQSSQPYSGYEAQRILRNPAARQTATNDQIDTALGILQSRGVQNTSPTEYRDFESWASDKKAKNEEERLYRGRNKNAFHETLDNALGKEGLGGFANDLLGYSPLGIAADTFMPEWAMNPETQESAAKKTAEAGGPIEFNPDFSMPSAEQMQVMQGDDLARWQRDAGDLAEKDIMALMAFNPGGQEIAAAGKVGGPTLKEMGQGFADVAKEVAGGQAGKQAARKSGIRAANLEDAAAQQKAVQSFYERYTPEQIAWMRGEGELEKDLARRQRMLDNASAEATRKGEQEDLRRSKVLGESKRKAEDDYNQRVLAMDSASREATRAADLPSGSKMTVGKFMDMIRRIFGHPTSGLTSGSRIAPDGTILMDDAVEKMFGSQVPKNVAPDGTILMDDAADSVFGKAAENVKWDPTKFRTADTIRAERQAAKEAAAKSGKAASKNEAAVTPESLADLGDEEAARFMAGRFSNAANNVTGKTPEEIAAEAVAAGDEEAARFMAGRGVKATEPAAGTAESAAQQAAQGAEQAGEKASNSVYNAMSNIFRGVGEKEGKSKEKPSDIISNLNKQSKELEDKIAKLPEGSKEMEDARKELADISRQKVKLAEKNPEVMANLLEQSSGRAKLAQGMLRPSQEKRLASKYETILEKNAQAQDRFSGNADELAEFLGEDLIERSQALPPSARDFLARNFSAESEKTAKPTRAMYEEMLAATEKANARAPKLDQWQNYAAAGGKAAIAVAGGIGAFIETANTNKTSVYGTWGIDEKTGNMTYQPTVPPAQAAAEMEANGDVAIDEQTGNKVWGVTQQEWDNMTQREQFVQAQISEEFENHLSTYGDENTGEFGFEAFRDKNADTEEQKKQLIGDLIGVYNDGLYELPGWKEGFEQSGVDLSGTDEEDIDAIYEFMFGDKNIINAESWLYGDDAESRGAYQAAHNLGIDDDYAAAMAGTYMLNQDGTDLSKLVNEQGASIFPEDYDNADLGALIAYQNLLAHPENFKNYDQADLNRISDILNYAGDNTSLMFSEDPGAESIWQPVRKPEKYGWNAWNDAILSGKMPVDFYGDDFDEPGVENVIDKYLVDQYGSLLEKNLKRSVKKGEGKRG